MHFRGLDLNLLVALDAMLSERNVTRAAERLNVSQPSMSAALQKLRWHFDDELLERVGRRLRLTPRAVELIEPLREVLFRVDHIVRMEPAFDPTTATRVFRASMSNFCSDLLVPPLVSSLLSSAPRVNCEIDDEVHEGALTRLDEGQSDVLITLAQRPLLDPNYHEENYGASPLFKDRMVLVSAQKNAELHDSLTYDDLCNLSLIEVRTGRFVGVVELTLRRQKLRPQTRVWVTGFMQALLLISSSELVGILPERLIDKYASILSLKKAQPPLDFMEIEETMFWNKRNDVDPGHCWFRAQLQAAAAKL